MSSILDNVSLNGLGLMTITFRAEPIDKATAFAAMNKAIEMNLPEKTLFNAGEFYDMTGTCLNLVYVKEFFEKYPEQRKHVVVSVKGAYNTTTMAPSVTKEGINTSVENCLKYVPDLDVFEPARLDPEVPFAETVAALDAAVDAGKFKGYTFSEISAETLGKVAKLAKHKPLGVEVEYSLINRDLSTNGLAAIAGELDIPIIAYSPIGMGLLSGQIKSLKDLGEGDVRVYLDRFTEENLSFNQKLFAAVTEIAKKKGVTAAQISLAWVKYHSGKTINGVKYPTMIPIPSCSSVSRVEENFANVVLTEEEFNALQDIVENNTVAGGRYAPMFAKYLNV